DGTGPQIGSANSLTDTVTLGGVSKPLTQWMVEGVINPGQLNIVREILYDATGKDTAVYWGDAGQYAFSYKGQGRLVVDHVDFDDAAINAETAQPRFSDGTDVVRNIEELDFADGKINVVTGTSNTGNT